MEKIKTLVYEDAVAGSKYVAVKIRELIEANNKQGKKTVLGLATGSSPLKLYAELIRMHKEENLSFANVVTFNLDEYFPMQPNAEQSYVKFMFENLFNHIDIKKENVNIPDLEYDVLLYVANWPEKRNHAWKTLLTARSIENQCYTIGVNRVGLDGKNIMHSGDSMVVGPLGEILYHCAYEEDIFHITLQKEELIKTREQFPFWKNADFFNIE